MTADFIFVALILFKTLFAACHLFKGIFHKRKANIIIHCISIVITWLYVTIYYMGNVGISTLEHESRMLVLLFTPISLVFCYVIVKKYSGENEFASTIVRDDPDHQPAYKAIMLHDAMVDFDFEMNIR